VIHGFHEAGSHRVVDIDMCPVLTPSLSAILAPIRDLLRTILPLREQARIILADTTTGVDLGLELPRPPDLAALETLSEFANDRDLARLWWRISDNPPIPVAARRAPLVRPGGIAIELPPSGFQQATEAGEMMILTVLREFLAPAQKLVDLFSGIGTFALPLATGRIVHAVEADPQAVAALQTSARRANLPHVTAERRDLEARPLVAQELDRFDAVILDPPRAGAKAQSVQLASSRVRRIAMVSCNPHSFARDAACLVAGGYQLEHVQPIDQFVWSGHVELVSQFSRAV
jgi:23S rRNA (uracil1939-C5)-methyltransferase